MKREFLSCLLMLNLKKTKTQKHKQYKGFNHIPQDGVCYAYIIHLEEVLKITYPQKR